MPLHPNGPMDPVQLSVPGGAPRTRTSEMAAACLDLEAAMQADRAVDPVATGGLHRPSPATAKQRGLDSCLPGSCRRSRQQLEGWDRHVKHMQLLHGSHHGNPDRTSLLIWGLQEGKQLQSWLGWTGSCRVRPSWKGRGCRWGRERNAGRIRAARTAACREKGLKCPREGQDHGPSQDQSSLGGGRDRAPSVLADAWRLAAQG